MALKTINGELGLLCHAFTLAAMKWEWGTENSVLKIAKEKVRNHIERWLVLQVCAEGRTNSTEAVFMNGAGHPGRRAICCGRSIRWMRKAGIMRFRFLTSGVPFATRFITSRGDVYTVQKLGPEENDLDGVALVGKVFHPLKGRHRIASS